MRIEKGDVFQRSIASKTLEDNSLNSSSIFTNEVEYHFYT